MSHPIRFVRLSRIWAALLLLALIAGAPANAQNTPISLTVAVPDFAADAFSAELLAAFEAAHPGVRVVPVRPGVTANVPPIELVGAEAFFAAARAYAETADVLFVDGYGVTPEIVRAGYLLDLAPLAATDPALDPAAYYPAIWDSYRWDGGLWALPLSVQHTVVIYDRAAFDAAGLGYPHAGWTLDDFAAAARALTVRDADGAITLPGLYSFETAALLRALGDAPFYDSTSQPNTPRLNTPALAGLVNEWRALLDEGVAASSDGIFMADGFASPLVIGPASQIMYPRSDGRALAGALLPGDRASIRVSGFAASAGTAQPALAYELAKFLSREAGVRARVYSEGSVLRAETSPTAPGVDPAAFDALSIAVPEAVALLTLARERAFPVGELRFGNALVAALNAMGQTGAPTEVALAEAEATARDHLLDAEAARAAGRPVVAAAPAPVTLAPGEIALTFGLMTFSGSLHNQAQWDAAVAEFAAADPQVGHIEIMTARSFDSEINLAEQTDCFYTPTVALPGAGDAPTILSLDPFMSADPTFDPADALNGVMAAVTRDGRTWALPMRLAPEVLLYDRDALNAAGVLPPAEGDGWTTDQFNDALNRLRASLNAPGVLVSSFGNRPWLMLIAAYGGLPADYRGATPRFSFTDADSLEATRQVLTLARDGWLAYSALATPGAPLTQMPPVYPMRLEPLTPFFEYSADIPFRAMPHPRGGRYAPASYTLGAGAISASSPAADACYRWLRQLAARPDLFSAMPAYRSLLAAPVVTTALGPQAAAFYARYAALLDAPEAVVFPSESTTGLYWQGLYFTDRWINRAFDAIVLDGDDPLTALTALQTTLDEYLACAAPITETVFAPYAECATQVDPTIR